MDVKYYIWNLNGVIKANALYFFVSVLFLFKQINFINIKNEITNFLQYSAQIIQG